MEENNKSSAWNCNIDIFNLFITKEIVIYNNYSSITFKAPTVEDLTNNANVSFILSFLKRSFAELEPMVQLWKPKTCFDIFMVLLTAAGDYAEYARYKNVLLEGFSFLFKEKIEIKQKLLYIGDTILTEDLYNYIVYVVRKVSGDNIEPPRIFKSKEEEEFYKQMKESEDRIKKIKQNAKNNGSDILLKMFILIQYAFPQYSFEFLTKQTLLQIIWLRDYASKAVNYQVEEKIFAAGNMKKKLKFFLEN